MPYYRDSAVYPDQPLTDLAELAALPMLTKRKLLDTGIERFHDPALRPRHYRTDVTSGTSGIRLEIRHDIDGYGYHGATVLRRFLRSGYRPWWRIAHLKPFPRPVRWFQRLGLFPRTVVLASQPDEVITRQVLAVRPQVIMGYPVVLRTILRTLSAQELTRLRTHLRLVMTDSELLTDEAAAKLTEGFGVPVRRVLRLRGAHRVVRVARGRCTSTRTGFGWRSSTTTARRCPTGRPARSS